MHPPVVRTADLVEGMFVQLPNNGLWAWVESVKPTNKDHYFEVTFTEADIKPVVHHQLTLWARG